MKKLTKYLMSILFVALPLLSSPALAADHEKDEDRLKNSGIVLKEILDVPDDIPQDLLDKADCVVVFPSVLKAAFIVGGSYGRGAMSCRQGQGFRGRCGAPTMMALEGGSFGFQIGGEATDFVLLIMNERGASGILTSKVKLGADALVAAGPVGRCSICCDKTPLSRDQPFALMVAPTSRFMGRGFLRNRSCGPGESPSQQPPRDWFRHWTQGLQTISHKVVET